MKIGVMQAYFIPYIGYFQLIDAVDTFIMYEYVTFRKRSWITKNRLLDKGRSQPFELNVPVSAKSSYKRIEEIEISEGNYSRKKTLKQIELNYKKALFFNDVYPLVERLISIKETSIHRYNSLIVQGICEFLEIKTKIIFENSSSIEMEEQLSKKVIDEEEEKTRRIFEICKAYKADVYINPIGGIDLYKKEPFKKEDIDLFFVETEDFSYKQFKDDFVPYLSIIDVLMHNGKSKTQELIKKYNLK